MIERLKDAMVCNNHFEQHQPPMQCVDNYLEPSLFARDNVVIQVASCSFCLQYEVVDNMFNINDNSVEDVSLQSMARKCFGFALPSKQQSTVHYLCETCTVRLDMTHAFKLQVIECLNERKRLLRKMKREMLVFEQTAENVNMSELTGFEEALVDDGLQNTNEMSIEIKNEMTPLEHIIDDDMFPLAEAQHVVSSLLGQDIVPQVFEDEKAQDIFREQDAEFIITSTEDIFVKEETQLAMPELSPMEERAEEVAVQLKSINSETVVADISIKKEPSTESLPIESVSIVSLDRCIEKPECFDKNPTNLIQLEQSESSSKPIGLVSKPLVQKAKGTAICNVCQMTFAQPKHITSHFKEKHPDIELKFYSCTKCDEVFFRLSPYTSHRYLHSDRFACEYCGKRHASQYSLANHHTIHHGVPRDERFYEKCPICNESIIRQNLNRHILKHKL